MEASESKSVNSILNIIGVNLLRLGDLHILLSILFKIYTFIAISSAFLGDSILVLYNNGLHLTNSDMIFSSSIFHPQIMYITRSCVNNRQSAIYGLRFSSFIVQANKYTNTSSNHEVLIN